MQVTQLTAEYRSHLLGTDVKKPRLAWQLDGEGKRGVSQTAYQIQVSQQDADFQSLVWDTGKIAGNLSIQIPYEGKPLSSRTRYFYRVRAWDEADTVSPWSQPDWFETAFMEYTHWRADWITPEYDFTAPKTAVPILRRGFTLRGEVADARIYITAKGLYELYINGTKAGEDFLTPGWTSYNHRTLYQTYDVTSLLKSGENAMGVMIGSGWYKGELGWRGRRNLYGGREALIAELHIRYADGSEELVPSDDAWNSSYQGPITYAELYHGETYDARRELPWSCAAFDAARWDGVRIMGMVDKSILRAQECESVRVRERLKPIALLRTPNGELLLDFGQNMAGWVRFKVKGQPGDCVELSHGELLDADGNLYTDNLKGAKQRIIYFLKGEGVEEYRPHFTWQGFRYVRIDQYPGEPKLANFEGMVLCSDLEETGSFSCSEPMLNQLQHNILWGQRGNFVDIPTDCPQRCERLGWTGDIQIFARTAAFNMKVPLFLTKWLRDLAAEQFPNGGVPWVIPDIYDDTYRYDLKGYYGQSEATSAAWGDAAIICPWTLYLAYGDKRILEEQYESMKAYIAYIRNQGDNPYLWDTGYQLGDWVALDAPYGSFIGATDVYFVATAYYAYSTRILQKTAEIIGNARDANEYAGLYDNILQAFQKRYVDENGELRVKTQTAIVLAVQFDLIPEADKQHQVDLLAQWLQRTDYALITGFVGTPYICHVLSRYGHTLAAEKLLLKTEYPSWLYQISKGATTIWEHLDGVKPDGTFWNPRMNSFNHYAYGSVGEWLYRGVAGLNLDESQPGYGKFSFQPVQTERLTFAEASIQSMRGRIRVRWESLPQGTRYEIQAPGNTTACVRVPRSHRGCITENGLPLEQTAGVLSIRQNGAFTEIEIGSGTYCFETTDACV